MPGRIDTDRIRSLDRTRAERTGMTPEECRADAIKTIPMGRYGDITEFGKAAAFLLSDAASYITGAPASPSTAVPLKPSGDASWRASATETPKPHFTK
jgi:NAD(P)-dependent dehydrogenase (short-subunit alcohol dehydrogenase family)